MKLVVGLGNPGEKYENTRHNAGFMALDALESRMSNFQNPNDKQIQNSKLKYEKKFEAEICKIGEVMLVKPQTYMNRSGEAVRKILEYFSEVKSQKSKVKSYEDLYVVHDDLDIVMGEWKLKFGSGPKEHNGVNSVREALGTDQFWYGRVGVDGRKQRLATSEQRIGENGQSLVDGGRWVGSQISGREYVLMQLQREERVEMARMAGEMAASIITNIQLPINKQ